jgi:ketosteroid isomerase-like protein
MHPEADVLEAFEVHPMRFTRLLAAALSLTLATNACNSGRLAPPTVEGVVALERAWSDAFIRQDTDAISSILADDFVGIDGRGVVSDKAGEIQEARASANGGSTPVLVGEQLSDIRVPSYGGTAVLTAINTARFASKDGESTIRYRRTTVWVQREGRWQCVSFHGSRILD